MDPDGRGSGVGGQVDLISRSHDSDVMGLSGRILNKDVFYSD